MRYDRGGGENNTLHSNWLLTKQERMSAVHKLRVYSFILCTALCLHQTLQKMPPEGRWPACGELKCHLTKFKGQPGFEPLVPYQGAVVFAVLVGQVCNGGCNAGTEKLLSLVKVALMDFIEELMVSAHINKGYEFISARGNIAEQLL